MSIYVEMDQFEANAHAYAALIDSGAAVVSIDPWGIAQLLLLDEPPTTVLQEWGVSRASLRSVRDDLEDVLTAICSRVGEARFVDVRSTTVEDARQPEAPDVARRKYRIVEAALDSDDLRQRAWLKESAKAARFWSAGWELAMKLDDDDFDSPDGRPVPYVKLRIEWRPEDEPRTVGQSMVVDQVDLRVLSNTLDRLRSALKLAESSGQDVG